MVSSFPLRTNTFVVASSVQCMNRRSFIMRFLTSTIILLFVASLWLSCDSLSTATKKTIPLVVTTWDYFNATKKAWEVIYQQKRSAIDAIEAGCTLCEELQCRKTVGFGGSPDESGETTLDAMIMDGLRMDVGAVGGLRGVKNAIGVARKVLENTEHTLLVGDLATQFAVQMGFASESLQTSESRKMWIDWKANQCQPNFWKNVVPDSKSSCGPYRPLKGLAKNHGTVNEDISQDNHDTIGMIGIDMKGHIAAGTSTNGARNKIPGRVGDSPVPGSGCYADEEVGAAAGTGDGDIMMRFNPSFLAVEEMRRGASPSEAAETAIRRISKHYPKFVGAVIALDKSGEYGAACNGIDRFPFYVSNPLLGEPTATTVPCIKV